MAASFARLVTWRNSEAARRQTEVGLHALAERTKRLEVIRGVTEEITRELDLTTLLELIAQRAAALIGGALKGDLSLGHRCRNLHPPSLVRSWRVDAGRPFQDGGRHSRGDWPVPGGNDRQ